MRVLEVSPLNWVILSALGASVAAWPLYQGELPPSWGEWPLNLAVMGFVVIVLRIVAASSQKKDEAFAEAIKAGQVKLAEAMTLFRDAIAQKDTAFAQALKEAQEQYAKSVTAFAEALIKVQSDGHAHGEDIRKALNRLSVAVEKMKSPRTPKKK